MKELTDADIGLVELSDADIGLVPVDNRPAQKRADATLSEWKPTLWQRVQEFAPALFSTQTEGATGMPQGAVPRLFTPSSDRLPSKDFGLAPSQEELDLIEMAKLLSPDDPKLRVLSELQAARQGIAGAVDAGTSVGGVATMGLAGPVMRSRSILNPIARLFSAMLGSSMVGHGLGTASVTETEGNVGGGLTEAGLGGLMTLPIVPRIRPRPIPTRPVGANTPDVPVTPRMLEDVPIDVEASVIRGNELPPASRFVRHPGGELIDTTQLSPSEQNVMYQALARQVARDILEIQSRQTRPKQGEAVVLGEQPQPREVVLIPPVQPQTIVPANQAAGEAKQGGQISFAGQAGTLPTARQQAVDMSPKPTEQEVLMQQSFVPSEAKPEAKPEPLVRLADILERIEKILPREGVEQVSGVATPAVTSQVPTTPTLQQPAGKPLSKEWQVTVQQPQRLSPTQETPGYVQLDEIVGGQNVRSTNPETLRKEGFEVPDFSSLPQGKYTIEQATQQMKGGETSGQVKETKTQADVLTQKQSGLGVKAAMQRGQKRRSETGALMPSGAEGRMSPTESPLQSVRVLQDQKKIGFATKARVAGQQLWNRMKNVMGQDASELKVLEETTGIKEFLKGDRTPEEVARFVAENGPRVEVHSYGMEGRVSEARREYDALRHEWDSMTGKDKSGASDIWNGINPLVGKENMSQRAIEVGTRLHDMKPQIERERDTSPRATSAYETVSAFNTKEPMPEWTASKEGRNVQRVDVVIPEKSKEAASAELQKKGITGQEAVDRWDEHRNIMWQPDNLHENLPNTLGWAMIQYKTGPKGEKVAVIVEAQSRWGQSVRERKQKPEIFGTKLPDEHPLLRDYNRLILKAAIEQARKEGATHVVVSDAETAMMTEGHDIGTQRPPSRTEFDTLKEAERWTESLRRRDQYNTKLTKEGDKWVVTSDAKIVQEPGMRLNYDKILPSIMEELTGKKGEEVSLGEHKNAFEKVKQGFTTRGGAESVLRMRQAAGQWEGAQIEHRPGTNYPFWIEGYPRQNLIFRNPDGTPKTTVTGRMYPLPSIEFTIMGKDKAPKALEAPRGEAGLAKNLRKEGGMTQQGEKGMLNLDVVKEAVDKLFAPIRFYSEPLVERLGRLGGPVSKQVSKEAQQIVARAKEFYGKLTPTLDEAKKAAGRLIGPGTTGGTTWARGRQKITDKAAINNIFAANEGRITVPKKAQKLVGRFNAANREIGALAATASPGFTPSGKLQRMLTAYGIDVVRRGGGPAWEAWTRGVARANGASVADVQRFYRRWKRELDEAGPDVAALDRINQDFRRQFPNTVTHIKVANAWHEVLVSDPFAYLEVAAQRTAHAAAFREVYKPGTGLLENTRKAVQAELQTHRFEKEFDSLMRALQGHPTDSYTAWWNAPDSALGQAGRMTTATLMAPMRALMLTGNAITNFAESVLGGPAIYLGYRNVIPAMWKLPSFYKQLEMNGALNKALQNYAFDPTSPVRSIFRIASNVVRMTTFQQVLNEFQEATAAAAARIVANRIRNNDMSSYELERIKAVMNQMGLDGTAGIKGDAEVLSQFERKAASWLTAGNQAMAERSRLGTSRLFNEMFWFQSYPMMTMNQLRANMGQLVKAIEAGDKKQAQHQATLLARLIGGRTLQGVGLTYLLALVFEWIDGVKERKQEAKDEMLEFLLDSWLAAQGGPLTVIKRTLEQSGDSRSLQNAIAATSTPVSIGSEWYDAALGNGRYEGLTADEKVAKFVTSKTPGWRIIKTVMAVSKLSNEDLKLQAALKAFYRWRREELGAKNVVNLGPQDETDVQFRAKMRRAVEAIRKGEDWRKELQGESAESAFDKMLARRVLRTPDGKELTTDQLESLRARIGDVLVDRLEEHDEMLRMIAYEIVGRRAPRQERERQPSRRQERVIE